MAQNESMCVVAEIWMFNKWSSWGHES